MRCLHCYKKGAAILPLCDSPKGYYGQCNDCSYVVPKYISDSSCTLFIAIIIKKVTKDYGKVIAILRFLKLYNYKSEPR